MKRPATSVANVLTWKDPKVRKRRIRGIRRALKKNKEVLSLAAYARWRKSSYRLKQAKARKRNANNPVFAENRSNGQRSSWKNPVTRARRSRGIRRSLNKPQVKRTHRKSLIKAWKGPNKKARLEHLSVVRLRSYNRFVPNQGELILKRILDAEFPGEFVLNVNGRVSVAGAIPDFVHKSLPIAVELFGDHWHKVRPRRLEESRRRRKLAKAGYRTVIVWASTLRTGAKNGSIKRKVNLAKHWVGRVA